MTTRAQHTDFAPATRSSRDDVLRQHGVLKDAFWSGVLNSLPEIILILNDNRQIVYANEVVKDMLGLPDLEEVLGCRPGEALQCRNAEINPAGCGTSVFCSECGAVKAILAGIRGDRDVQECRITQTDGNALDLRVCATPLDIAGERFVVFAVADIAGDKRRQTLERTFLHDILNTAGGLKGLVELSQFAEPEEQREYQGLIADLAIKIVDEIKAQQMLIKAERGDLELEMTRIDAEGFLQSVAELYRSHEVNEEKRCLIELTLPEEPASFTSDKRLLGRVLGNMVKNAIEASPSNAVVTIGCRVSEGKLTFGVHNTSYMPKSVQLQVFQRSFSTKGTGRGLGTYSMRLLTENYLQGEIDFESTETDGTAFYVTYPAELD